jgi:heme O synthase-like polyprenyltransferase
VALAAGARTIVLTSQLRTGDRVDELTIRRVFAVSMVYLFSLFAVYLVQEELTAHFWLS